MTANELHNRIGELIEAHGGDIDVLMETWVAEYNHICAADFAMTPMLPPGKILPIQKAAIVLQRRG